MTQREKETQESIKQFCKKCGSKGQCVGYCVFKKYKEPNNDKCR